MNEIPIIKQIISMRTNINQQVMPLLINTCSRYKRTSTSVIGVLGSGGVPPNLEGPCEPGLGKIHNWRISSLSIHECKFELYLSHLTGNWIEMNLSIYLSIYLYHFLFISLSVSISIHLLFHLICKQSFYNLFPNFLELNWNLKGIFSYIVNGTQPCCEP